MRNYFEHYAAVEALYEKFTAPVCQRFDLTSMEFTVLMFLANNPKFDTAAQIVRYRHLTKSHVSITIHSLQNSGLLQGHNDPSDRRIFRLSVTQAAAPIIRAGREIQQAFSRCLFADFSPEEQRQVQNFIRRVDANVIHAEEELENSHESGVNSIGQ